MGFISSGIKRKEEEVISNSNNAIAAIDKKWSSFLKKDTYLVYDDQSELLDKIRGGQKITAMPWYFFWHRTLKQRLHDNLSKLGDYKDIIESYDKKFVTKKKEEYKYLFKKGDYTLDDDQQTAIVTDDKHNLVVAGAGSGKTEVLTTRIAYLVKRKSDRVKPSRILALAFQDKAAQEIKTRLKSIYKVDVEIRTFHSLGNKIILDASHMAGKKVPKLNINCSEEWKFQRYIQKLFETEIAENKDLLNQVIRYTISYGTEPIIKDETDFETKEEFYKYQQNLNYIALNGTKVKSESERQILNFFIMHKLNDRPIIPLYEKPAEWMKYENKEGEEIIPKPDFYFEDFDLYMEHWAIGTNGKVPPWFKGENPTEQYKETMKIKKEMYQTNNKSFFDTSEADIQRGNLLNLLSEKFLRTLKEKYPDKSFVLTPIQYRELVEAVWEVAQSVKQIPLNISRFIVIAKTYRLYPMDIEKRLKDEKWSSKQLSFAEIANIIYTAYEKEMRKDNNIDFSDMINLAVDYLKANKEFYTDRYDHILIDEYQDISTQRYEMIKALMDKNEHCKLFCVGDDWQSIMGFAGSNLDFFINFASYFSHPARTDLTINYRSTKTIVDVGASIIKNNKGGSIEKKTVAKSKEEKPILIYSSKHQKDYYARYYKQIAIHCLDKIKEYHTKFNYPYDDFMILMRISKKLSLINNLSDYAKELGIPMADSADKPHCVHVLSVHKSKGLQARVIIILNVDRGLYGFPCELEDPDIFQVAIKNNDGLRKEEERRLFYVAVTRAKEEVIMYTQKCSESEFITEIKGFTKREELGY